MRIFNKDLKKALTLIKRKKFSQAIRFLEPKVPIFLEDQNYYYLLAVACFHTSDLAGSKFYLERGLSIDESNVDMRLLLALAALRRKDSTAAAKAWLGVLQFDADNRKALKGLEHLRRLEDEQDMRLYLEKKKYRSLIPFIGVDTRRLVLTGLAVAALAVLLWQGIVRLSSWFGSREEPQREELNYIDMELRGHSLTDNSGSFTYLLTRDEVEQSYAKVIEYYDSYKDNLAQREVNRLLHSNASAEIKSKVELLQGYFKKPDYLDFYTDFTYTQAAEDPKLYQNCYVLWSGRVSNLKVLDDRIEFLFLVGFEKETSLEGIIPAHVDYAVDVDPEMAVEILGRLEWVDRKLGLKVETIRHIIVE